MSVTNVPKLLNLDLLTSQQRQFVTHFRGDPMEAARSIAPDASPGTQRNISCRMMQNELVRANIQLIRENLIGVDIADTFEVLTYWTDTLRDASLTRKDRTKASELLAKFHGMLNDVILQDNRTLILNAVEHLGALLPHEQADVRKFIDLEAEDSGGICHPLPYSIHEQGSGTRVSPAELLDTEDPYLL